MQHVRGGGGLLEAARRFAGDRPLLAAFDERVHHCELKLPRAAGWPEIDKS